MPLVVATGLLVDVFTAQQPDAGQTSTGANSGGYTNVIGLDSIPCMAAVNSMSTIAPSELRQVKEILDKAPRHVMLDANYPAIIDGWRAGWRAVVVYPDGTSTVYDIIGAETDSQTSHTRVELNKVSV